MKLNDAMIERAARGICAGRSLDPDEWFKYTTGKLVRDKDGNKVRLWTVYEKDARAALEAVLSECAVVKVRGRVGEPAMINVSHSMVGKRVALVVLDD